LSRPDQTTARVVLPPKLVSVFSGTADVRGAYGGRGSAKTRTFAKMTAVKAYAWAASGREGTILCARQFMNSLADSSLEEIKAAIRSEAWLEPHFDIGEKYIQTKDRRVYYTFSGLDRNIDSVKSKARILLCWIDEAEPVTEQAFQVLVPTLREEDSELWLTWNSKRKNAAVEQRYRFSDDPLIKIVKINWRDNPWFPKKLERERLRDFQDRPEQYNHIWEGDFATITAGAYYAKQLAEARKDGRFTRLARDDLMTIRAFWDIGGTGAKADATAIWIAQFVSREIRVLDYYEARGQPLATHVNWLRSRGYGNALCVLPHDGANSEKVFDASYEGALRQAGFEVIVVPNQGKGAASQRVEAARRLFPSIWFNEAKTDAGVQALGWYHAKIDDKRQIDLGPEHDWSSHAADAFGLMCIAYETPKKADDWSFKTRAVV